MHFDSRKGKLFQIKLQFSILKVDRWLYSSLPGQGEKPFLFMWAPKAQFLKIAFPSSRHGLIRYTLSFSQRVEVNLHESKTMPSQSLLPEGAVTYPSSTLTISVSLNRASPPPKMKSTLPSILPPI